jgi:exodeoxyribonuclease VII small subunit
VARNSKAPEFEQALAELEKLVETLERGDLPLDEALRNFERGVELTRHCQSALKAAQQRVEILLRRDGQAEAVPFEAESSEEDGGAGAAAGEYAAEGSVDPPTGGRLARSPATQSEPAKS